MLLGIGALYKTTGSLFEAIVFTAELGNHEWLISYNEERPHDALGSLPPALFRQQVIQKASEHSLLPLFAQRSEARAKLF